MKRNKKPFVVTAYVTILGTMALIPISFTSDWSLINSLQQAQWFSIIYLATICSGLDYFLWNFAISRVEAVRAAVWLYLELVAAFIGEAFIFGVMPCFTTLIGGTVIIIGALLTTRSKE